MNMKLNKRGVLAYMFAFILVALFIVFITAIVSPMGVKFSSEAYKIGEDIMLSANSSIQGIQNETIKNEIQGTLNSALGATQDNIDINSALFQYGWIFVLIACALVIFLFARQNVEVGGGLY